MEYQPDRISTAVGRVQRILQAGYATNLGSCSVLHIRIIRVFYHQREAYIALRSQHTESIVLQQVQ